MLTARGEVSDRARLNLGADDYLAKPFELSELEARVKRCCDAASAAASASSAAVYWSTTDARRFSRPTSR